MDALTAISPSAYYTTMVCDFLNPVQDGIRRRPTTAGRQRRPGAWTLGAPSVVRDRKRARS